LTFGVDAGFPQTAHCERSFHFLRQKMSARLPARLPVIPDGDRTHSEARRLIQKAASPKRKFIAVEKRGPLLAREQSFEEC
jgi:hypothetical protein